MKHFHAHLWHLRNSRPGRRFRDSHRRGREKGATTSAWRIGQGVLGLALILAGIFLMAVPGPGVPVLLLGLILLAAISHRTARLLDRGEVFMRLIWSGVRTKWQSTTTEIRLLFVLLTVAGMIAIGYGVLRMVAAFT